MNELNFNEYYTLKSLIGEDVDVTRLDESWILDKLKDLVQEIGSLPVGEYIGQVFGYLKIAAIVGLSVAAGSQLLGWVFIGIAKLIDKNVSAKRAARDAVYTVRYNEELENIANDKELSTEELYETYMGVKDKLAAELDEKFPMKGSEKWSYILDKTGRIVKDKIGTTALAIAGIFMYSRLVQFPGMTGGDPLSPGVAPNTTYDPLPVKTAPDAFGNNIPMLSTIGQNRPPSMAYEVY